MLTALIQRRVQYGVLRPLTTLFAALFLLCSATTVSGQHYEYSGLTAFDAGAYDNFGNAVAVEGDVAVIGAFGDDASGGTDSGSAYIYRREGPDWVYHQKIEPLSAEGGAYFGSAVDIIDDMIIVGARSHQNRGMAFVFRYDPYNDIWVEEDQLRPMDNLGGDAFGCSIAASGRYMAIGACMEDTMGSGAGAVYIYEYEDSIEKWVELSKFWASDGSTDEWFGEYLDMDGDYVVVGLYKDDPNGSRSGSAYIFQRSGGYWNQMTKLIPSDGSTEYYYGSDVAISGNTVIVGAKWDWPGASRCGSAYVYTGSGSSWSLQQKLYDPNGTHWDNLGCSVALDGDVAVIGALSDNDNVTDSGSAYVFTRSGSTWTQRPKLYDSGGVALDQFGCTVDVSGTAAVVGAQADSWNGTYCGSACAFGNVLMILTVDPDPLIGGQNATFTLSGGLPSTNSFLAYSLRGIGTTSVPQLNITIDLNKPAQAGGIAKTNSSGIANWTLPVPGAGSGRSVWFQALQYECKSSVLATSIQ
ncbi:MAG: hypothetical protein D8M59_06145 [Planctomycetes bacterium]|nr:hypothetical protein [Planctomycetota bacterium]NOG55078.1 hypothetical protein [Planctomycetota bacterium]